LQQVGVDEVVEVLDHDAADQVWIDGHDDRHRSQVTRPMKKTYLIRISV
jgi:hypothetical protein